MGKDRNASMLSAEKRNGRSLFLCKRLPLKNKTKKLRGLKIKTKKDYKFLSDVFEALEKNNTVRSCRSLMRLKARGSPLRTRAHGSSSEISTMNIVTKYPTSTIDKIRPQPRGGSTNHSRAPSGRR